MARPGVLLVILSLLVGCAPDPRSIKLNDVDLSDMSAVQEIRAQLDAEDGAALASYVVRHHIGSARFCGQSLTTPDGNPPATIGEAINLAIARDAEDRRALELARKPKGPRELAQQRWNGLVSDKELLIEKQSMLRAEHGASAERLPEWISSNSKMAEVDRQLIELKPHVFGSTRGD